MPVLLASENQTNCRPLPHAWITPMTQRASLARAYAARFLADKLVGF